MAVAFFGNLVADRISVLPSGVPLRVDSKQVAEKRIIRGGGNAANSAVQCARLGGTAKVISKVGADEIGHKLIAEMRAEGVNCENVVVARTSEGPTVMTDIIVAGPTRTIISMPYSQRVADLDAAADGFDDARLDSVLSNAAVLSIDGRHPAVALAAVKRARALGCFVLIEAEARAGGKTMFLSELMQLADGLVSNEDYPVMFHGVDVEGDDSSYAPALAAMLQDAPRARFVVVTRGARGCVAIERPESEGNPQTAPEPGASKSRSRSRSRGREKSKEELAKAAYTVPAFVLGADQPVLDSTGAGDSFIGALAMQIAAKTPLRKALTVACWAGACSCLQEGARGSMPSVADMPPAVAAVVKGDA